VGWPVPRGSYACGLGGLAEWRSSVGAMGALWQGRRERSYL
jgi:hypothetical protein